MSDFLAVRGELETLRLAGELRDRQPVRSVKVAGCNSGVAQFVDE